ncbi:hypothetical protein [Dermatobacter hominis]|uniref:hypothetical protein n=1 Tax=Dermatobacter hominis TaxID=2884263 RepID=UPI001D12CC65|nr:hypothetical protein [Dermatobacter hominis]UDY34877.1 hypothetical protein LH044_16245 [Dermatobacter hominis]
MASEPGGAPNLTAPEIEEARALLRRSDEESRRSGLMMVDRWGDRPPDPAAASALLRAATLAYPWVRSQRVDPALRLIRLLCRSPRSVEVREVEAAYLVSAERVRRVLLHLLALRRDAEGVVSLSFLIGPDGPADLLPLPTGGLLTPALSVPGSADMVPSLVHVASRPGWAWHAAELLQQLVEEGRLDEGQHRAVARGLAPVVASLVEACDRATLGTATSAGAPSDGERPGRDVTRADRFRLRSLVSLFRALPGDVSAPVLRRVLASADARVSALGATALLSAGQPIAPERLDLVARDPEARAELLDGLDEIDRLADLAPRWRSGRSRAEAELVRWLAADTELGARPDELEHVVTMAAGEHPDDGAVHMFRFRLRAPHWSSARGWMIGAAGPYREDGSVAEGFDAFASSVYSAEDEDELDGHLDTILDSLGVWPDADEL